MHPKKRNEKLTHELFIWNTSQNVTSVAVENTVPDAKIESGWLQLQICTFYYQQFIVYKVEKKLEKDAK